jgi:hypothetical protein
MRSWSFVLVAVLASATPVAASAQRSNVEIGPRPARVLWQPPPTSLERVAASEPLGGFLGPDDLDHRYTGFFVGGTLGLAATALRFAWCLSMDSECESVNVLPRGILTSGILGLSGALIGGLMPKAPRDPGASAEGSRISSNLPDR